MPHGCHMGATFRIVALSWVPRFDPGSSVDHQYRGILTVRTGVSGDGARRNSSRSAGPGGTWSAAVAWMGATFKIPQL